MNDNVTIIIGTNRLPANSRPVGLIYQEILQSKGVPTQLVDLAELPEDFIFSALYKNSGKNEGFNRFRTLMRETTKYVFIVPEYNGSFPGVLKAFIDGMEYPGTFQGKKSALVGISSGGLGGGLALSHFTDVLNYCGTHVLAFKPKLSRIEQNMIENKITNPFYLEMLEQQAGMLVSF